jgi:hypothetical protein
LRIGSVEEVACLAEGTGRSVDRAAAGPDAARTDPRRFGSAVHAALEAAAREGSIQESRLEAIASRFGLLGPDTARVREAAESFLRSPIGLASREMGAKPEVPFAVPIGESLLVGVMDLYARHGETATIVDYKTGGSTLAPDEAASRFASQARCYAIAALSSGVSKVRAVFVELERDCRETTFEFMDDDLGGLTAEVSDVLSDMAAGRYDPLESWDAGSCAGCGLRGSLCRINGPGRR